MATKLSTRQKDFPVAFSLFLSSRGDQSASVSDAVADIIASVTKNGDRALVTLTKRFDRCQLTPQTLAVPPEEIAAAADLCAPDLMQALETAARRIRDYSLLQMPENLDYTDKDGVRLGHRWTPIDTVGIYVPGGLNAYPSSVLMNAVPAKVAGVERMVMCVPAPDGKLNPVLLAAAHIAGVNEVYKIGGAQAIAAMALGTESVPKVDKIVGPGNAYVAEAKRQLFGKVGIDMVAGPSEILVAADNTNDAVWIATDLLSQAEHDGMAQSILVTDNAAFADGVMAEIETILPSLPRRDIAAQSWEQYGAVIVVDNMSQMCEIINAIAPEHLELAVERPEALLPYIRHAGAIFLGRHTPEAIGDYVAGPSHVLPTSGTARFSSGLSVYDFLKRSSIIGCTPDAFKRIGPRAETLADAEGLDAHLMSLRLRK